MNFSISFNDGVLLISLLYSCVDLQFEWGEFSGCKKPIHVWLLVSYVCVITFRLAHLLGMRSMQSGEGAAGQNVSGDFLLDMRVKNTLSRMLASFTWFMALPFFALWTGVGTSWFFQVMRDSPQCVPTTTHLWFAGCWLALSYVWITIHVALAAVAWMLERRVRRAEADLREIEGADTLSQWGQVSRITNYRQLANSGEKGLTPSEIRALPLEESFVLDQAELELDGGACECSICINELKNGDAVRRLPACGHTFHRGCIDLWLLRSADCPLCKRSVRRQTI